MNAQELKEMIATLKEWMTEVEGKMVGRGHGDNCECQNCRQYDTLKQALHKLKFALSFIFDEFDE